METKQLLMIPGPTPVPPRVLQALSTPMINHRGAEYQALQRELVQGCKTVYQTANDLMIYPAAGTGGMECAIVNTLSPGDKVLSISIGVFGDRFAKIAAAFGAEVDKLDFEWGTAADPAKVAEKLASNPYKAVLVTHNETSTGVTNDMVALAKVFKQFDVLVLVDAISGLIALPLATDELGLDVVIAGSQKAFMIPPGLTFLSVSKKAWEAHASAKMPRFYWDFTSMAKSMQKDQTPYTPALPQLFGLRESLKMIQEEGLENLWARHRKLAAAVRASATALGLELFADPKHASNAVTSIRVPAGVDVKDLRKLLRDKYGVVSAGGQQKLEPEIFRIGHLGYFAESDIIACMSAVERALKDLGREVSSGAAVRAAQEALAATN